MNQPGRNALFSFTGKAIKFVDAVAEATQRADAWLALHQWRDANGHVAYTIHTSMLQSGALYIYVIHLMGPSNPVEVAPW